MKKFNNNMETKTCIIPEATCLDVRAAQAEYESFRCQIADLIEAHCMDMDDSITDTPLFHGLVMQAAGAKKLWEGAKQHMIAPVEEKEKQQGRQITTWNLAFDGGELIYQTVPAQTDRSGFARVMEISAETCDSIQESHSVYDALSDTVNYLVGIHAGDITDTITPSTVYQGFQHLIRDARMEFEEKKEKMLKENFSKAEKAKITHWSLDYGKRELRYSVA